MDVLSGFTRKELAEIYCNLNCYKWDDRLGEMPNYDNSTAFNRHFHIKPYLNGIVARTSEFVRSRAWHLIVLKRSKLQFYRYWIFRRLCGLRRI